MCAVIGTVRVALRRIWARFDFLYTFFLSPIINSLNCVFPFQQDTEIKDRILFDIVDFSSLLFACCFQHDCVWLFHRTLCDVDVNKIVNFVFTFYRSLNLFYLPFHLKNNYSNEMKLNENARTNERIFQHFFAIKRQTVSTVKTKSNFQCDWEKFIKEFMRRKDSIFPKMFSSHTKLWHEKPQALTKWKQFSRSTSSTKTCRNWLKSKHSSLIRMEI